MIYDLTYITVDDLRVDNSISNFEDEYSESEDSDFDNPSVPLPPPEPPDEEFDFEIEFGDEISVVRNIIVKFECIDARVKFDVFNDETDDLSYFMFVIFDKVFSLLSAESEDTIFDPEMDQPNHTFAKIRILDTGKFEQWKFRIQQYLQNEHYALWEVIEFGDSYKAPQEEATSESFAKKKGRTVVITTEDMQKRRNDVKARRTLLLALPDEHQLRFSKYETAKELWKAILKTFNRNEATKKTKKNQLKQQYGNFKAKGLNTLEQTFNRLQAIVSHLEFMGVEIEQGELNQRFLISLAPEWLMYTIVWKNRDDLDIMSLDDVYNHLNMYEPEVQKKSESNSQISFLQPTPAVEKIDEDDIEEMDIKWNMALLSMRADRFWKKTGKKITIQGTDMDGFNKSKVECFNCHKMGHFSRECRAPRSQDRGRRESYKQGSKEEEPAPKALMAIDGIGWDWSYMANEEENHALVADDETPIKFALMAKSSSSSENEVYDDSFCSKFCRKNVDSLNTKISKLNEELSDSENTLYHYKLGLSQVEARLVELKTQEIKLCEKIRGLEIDVEFKNNKIEYLMNELEQVKKEKEGLDSKLTGFKSASKDLDTLLGSQKIDKNKEGLGYSVVPPSCSSLLSFQERYVLDRIA
nr:hypothetical protein [Tanacetum cinerariifolium]